MRLYGLVGYPLTHSFSQRYFTEKFKNLSINDVVYQNFSIPSIEELPNIIANTPALLGFNITIPYKKQVVALLHDAEDAVNNMGACNCISIQNKQLKGFNTDIIGFEQSLLPHLQKHHTKALILGTGGAAAAVQYVLTKLNIAYKLVSRNANDGIFSYDQLTQPIFEEYTLIINTSPVGQYPNIDVAPAIPYHFINSQYHLFDLIYNPTETTFLKKGREHGATIQNGYEMLVLQAEESWRIWNETI